MRTKIAAILMFLMLLSTSVPLMMQMEPVNADPAHGPSLIVDDSINRINATLGAKAGSKATVSGTVTNMGAAPLAGLLTAIYLRDDAHSFLPAHITGEWSSDGITWGPMAPAYAPGGAWDVTLILGPPGGYPLLPAASSTTFVRITTSMDIGTSAATQYRQTVAVFVFQDVNLNYRYDSGIDILVSQQPGPIFDTPVKVDLAIWHTVELDPTPPEFFYNIQDAIDAAIGGETIYVYDGTYKEALHITESLTIKAASTPIIKGSAVFATDYGNREAVIFVEGEGDIDVILEDLDIQGEGLGPGPTKSYGLLYQNASGTIHNCIVSPNTIGDMYSTAVSAISAADLTVEECLIENFGRIGVYCTNAEIVIDKNEIIGQTYSADNLVNYGIEIEDYDGPSTATITKNEIYNCNNTHPAPLWSSAAIISDIWRIYYELDPSFVTIEHNKIYNNYLAIEIVVGNGYEHAYYNCIYDNLYGVYTDTDYWGYNSTFDARYNWWGDLSGPYHATKNPSGLGDDVGDYVRFDPWLTSAGFNYHRERPVVDELVTFDASLFTLPCSALKTVVSYTWNFDDGNVTVTADPVIEHAFAAVGDYDVSCTVTYDDMTTISAAETVHVYTRPYLTVEPSYVLGGNVGSQFSVDVKMNDLDVNLRVVSVEFRLCYDAALLGFFSVVEGPFMLSAGGNTTTYFIGFNDTDAVYGPHVLVGVITMPHNNVTGEWLLFPAGTGTIATITFEVLYRPVAPDTATCALALKDTQILDDIFEGIGHSIIDGMYEASQMLWPTLKVEPALVQVGIFAKEFQVNVTMNDLDVDYRTASVQFRVLFNRTLLEATDVTEGPFMAQAGDTYFISYIEDHPEHGWNVIVGILVLPDEHGEWTSFPNGTGTLATITFKAAYQERGLEKPVLTCDLELDETLVLNDDIDEMPHYTVSGVYEIHPTNLGDVNFDGKVDMRDIGLVALAFGTSPSNPGIPPRWNEAADVNFDGQIDLKDVGIAARNFGWIPTHDC